MHSTNHRDFVRRPRVPVQVPGQLEVKLRQNNKDPFYLNTDLNAGAYKSAIPAAIDCSSGCHRTICGKCQRQVSSYDTLFDSHSGNLLLLHGAYRNF